MKFIGSICSIVLMVIALSAAPLKAQPGDAIYAASADPEVGGSITFGYGSVTSPNNAVGGKPNNSFATLKADGLGRTASLQLIFQNLITASSQSPVTTYIRTDINASGFSANISVTAYNGSGSAVTTPAYTIYFLGDGTVYLGVTLTTNFNSVKISLSKPLLTDGEIKVYYAFHSPSAYNTSNPYPFNVADCGLPNVSTKQDVSVLLGRFIVTNPGNALDGDTITNSSFTTNGVALGSTQMKQTFHFNAYSNESDAIRIVISKSGSLLAASLASNITLKAYNGEGLESSVQLAENLIDADLLGLINNSKKATFYFYPKKPNGDPFVFDRLEVSLNIAILGVEVAANALNIHDIRRVPGSPGIPPTNTTVCTNVGSILLRAISPLESYLNNLTFKWYTGLRGGEPVKTAKEFTPTGLNKPGTKSYYLDVTKNGCPLPSARHQINLTVTNAPTSPPINLVP